ncbi:MAG TPA: hypothetical protein VFE28_05475 [Candidatus Krumholzibacteria bacterium]|nr:hypothetical protein [Candidatus Krumholzibacteria bacterium]
MEYTEGQKTAFRDNYAKRRRRQLMVTVPMILLIIALAFTDDQEAGTIFGLSPLVGGSVFLVAFLALLAFSLRNWRCPACDKYLGRTFNPRHCQHCGVALHE